MEFYHISPAAEKLLSKLIKEWDAHEVAIMEKEGQVCRGCLYYITCPYSTKRKVTDARDNYP